MWNLDHGTIRLDDRTVVVVDEAGMADDTNLARLTLAAHRAGSAVVLLGDPRQLDAVGPGGALTGLISRHPDLVVTLDENVRQTNPAERRALAELRHGDPKRALDWYAAHDRLHVAPVRIETLARMADAWATDTAEGHRTALLAWRRDDVAALNRLARHQWDQLGRLSGDDIELGGRRYAVGDRVVTLVPNRTAGLVTCELLTVVDLDQDRLTARTDSGRTVTITGDGLDRLDYGYALTIHRAQGATYDRAHVLANGGGRELAYVALSRSRRHTTIHATADDLAQAVDDLATDWGTEHRQRWVNDTPARPGRQPEPDRIEPARPAMGVDTEPGPVTRAEARSRLAALHDDYQALHAGTGRWANTPEGEAARELRNARDQLDRAQRTANQPNAPRRDRRAATRSLAGLEHTLAHADTRWQALGRPTADLLQAEISNARREVERHDRQFVVDALDRVGPLAQERDIGLGL
jgi:hypothetical protein